MSHLFSEANHLFTPSELAAGPFKNLHGGAAASLMASVAIKAAPDGFIPVSQRSEFIRSTPLKAMKVTATTLRAGRRTLMVDVSISDPERDTLSARAFLTFYKTDSFDGIPPREKNPWGGHADPTQMVTLPDMPSPFGGQDKWMLTATDVRSDMQGVFWFKWRGPLLSDGWQHWFTRILGPADWAPGFISPHFMTPKQIGPWPNTDLSLHVDRPLSGDWIGIKPRGHYRHEGHGFAQADIYDAEGTVGHVTATVLAPAAQRVT